MQFNLDSRLNLSVIMCVYYCACVYAVHLSMSMITAHWLSEMQIPGATMVGLDYAYAREPGVPEQTRAAFAEKAHTDLSHFLEMRKNELVPGGEGVYLMVGGNGAFTFQENGLFTHALRQAIDEGLIPASALKAAHLNYYSRTEDEIARAADAVQGLDVVDVTSHTIVMGEKVPDEDAAQVVADLVWSIHAGSLRSSTGCSEAELDIIRTKMSSIVSEQRRPKVTYAMLAVRKQD